jgi:hypothetical protein
MGNLARVSQANLADSFAASLRKYQTQGYFQHTLLIYKWNIGEEELGKDKFATAIIVRIFW